MVKKKEKTATQNFQNGDYEVYLLLFCLFVKYREWKILFFYKTIQNMLSGKCKCDREKSSRRPDFCVSWESSSFKSFILFNLFILSFCCVQTMTATSTAVSLFGIVTLHNNKKILLLSVPLEKQFQGTFGSVCTCMGIHLHIENPILMYHWWQKPS